NLLCPRSPAPVERAVVAQNPGERVICGHDHHFVVVLHIHKNAEAQLFGVAETACLTCGLACLRKNWEQNRRKNCDNCDHYKELYERESSTIPSRHNRSSQ